MSAIEDQARSIFLVALERASDHWPAFLDEACGDDAELRARVDQLLHAHEAMGSIHGGRANVLIATVDDPSISERPGTVIGPYKLMEQIGEGGMGLVFVAEQQQPIRRKVALKVIKPGMDTRQVVARFEAERQALALMDHPNIAKVHDGGETAGGRPYFVMELVKGKPFTDYCDQNQVPIRERLELFVHVCQAVQHAHQKGIIHRDLKPSNVLITLHDGTPVVKVIDFGVAKAIGQQLTDKTIYTQFSQMVGTPLYMSPEQAWQSGLDVDTRSDIYSLGVLLYELLTGTTPFDKERLREVGYDEMRRIIREEEPPKPSTRISTLGQAATTISTQRQSEPKQLSRLIRGELDWIVMKALEKDRNRRYETASAFAADVQRYLHDEPVQACPPTFAYQLRKFARRNKGQLAAAVLVVFFLASLGGIAGWTAQERARREAELREAVAAGLDKVTDLRQRGRWGEARIVLEQMRQRLGPSDLEDLRRDVKQAEDDLALVDRLDAARLKASAVVDNHFDNSSAVREYAAAFREAGIGEETEAAEVVAERIRASAAREQLVAAVDDWASRVDKKEPARMAWLLAVARAANPDPWRNRFRDAAVRQDRAVLECLAREAKVRELSPQILTALGKLLEKSGGDAVPLLTAAQRHYPSDFWLNFELSRALAGAKRWEESIGYFRAALALRPATAAVYHNLGLALQDKGCVDEAFAEFQKAVELEPKYAYAHNHLGIALKDKGRVDEAIAEWKKALELDTRFADALGNLGRALRDKGREDEAIAEYQKALEIDPNFAYAHLYLGVALQHKGRLDEAIAEYQKALEIDPKVAYGHHRLGDSLKDKGRVDEAIAEYKKAIELDPKFVHPHVGLGLGLRDKGRLDEAIAEYQKALELNPKFAYAHLYLGFALKEKGRLDEATAAFSRFLALNPNRALVHSQLAWHLATCAEPNLRDPRRAVELAKKAVDLAPAAGTFWNTLGAAYYRAGDWKGAVQALKKSMELHKGGNSFDWFFLAMAHWQLGEKDQARHWYDLAVQWMDKNQPQNDELRRFRKEAAELMRVEEKNE